MRALLPPALILAGLALACHGAPAAAATLRPMTTLHAGEVRLSDLFAGVAPADDRVLGPGPAPGARIVVEAPQLAAIARQFGVDWRPASPGDRAVLQRPGQPMPRGPALAALRRALTDAGAPADCDVDLAGFVPPMVPLDADPKPVVEQMEYNATTGLFSAVLDTMAGGVLAEQTRVAGRAFETALVPVPTHRLMAGSTVGPQDVRMTRVPLQQAGDAVVQAMGQALGMEVRHQLAAGQPIQAADLGPPMLVRRGQLVTMRLDSAGLSVTAEGQALQSGGAGDTVRVLNPSSRAVIEAEVSGPRTVRVLPGSLPVPAWRRGVAVTMR
jgi:flagella basal body P-ring formation protein FlgA